MANKEEMRRRFLSKPPLHPQDYRSPITTVRPLKMLTPSPLSEASENSPYCVNLARKEAGKSSLVIPTEEEEEEEMVDLNAFPAVNPEAETERDENIGMKYYEKPEINCKIFNKKLEDSGSSSTGGRQRILSLDEAIENEKCGRNLDRDEERKLRRTVSNRLSAQRSRMKKSQYIAEMKKKIAELEDNVANLNPELETVKKKQTTLKLQKTVLEQQLKRCMHQSILLNRQIEEKKAEIRRLKELFMLKIEHLKMMNSSDVGVLNSASLALYPPPPAPAPESYYNTRVASSSIFQCCECEPKQVVEGTGMNINIDHHGAGIDQYLNLDALSFSSSTQPPTTDA